MKTNSKRKVFGDAVDLLMGDMEEVYTGSLGEPVGTGNGQGSAVCGGKEEVFL